ncbi:MAG: T9SS type A sorting domain-containing protein [Ignavibacteria bacterium]
MKKLFFLFPIIIIGFFLMTGQDTPQTAKWNQHSSMTRINQSGEYSPLPQSDIIFSNSPRFVSTPQGVYELLPNFRVHPSAGTQSEVPIVRHPTNPLIMMGSANTFRGGSTFSTGVYVTTDGGLSWYGSDTLNNGGFSSGDPGPMIDKDGRFLMSYITTSFSMGGSYSTNNGINWAPTVTFPGATTNADKNLSSTDDAPSSPFYGRSYTVYTEFGGAFNLRILLSYTSNGGVSWSTVAPVSPVPSPGHHHQGCDVRVGPNGEVYVIWANCTTNGQNSTEDSLGFAKSTDGGVSWAVTRNNASNMNGIRTANLFNGIRAPGFPRIDVDRSGGPRNGWIYVSTSEKTVAPATDASDALLHRSTDGGTTWTSVRVNQDTPGNGKLQYFSAVRVDEAGGVNVVYYDTRNTPTNDSAEVYVSRSLDGGTTWTDLLVSDHKFKPKPISGLAGGYQGDYIGITSGNGKIWPYWADDITGLYQAWITPVQIQTFPLNAFNLNTPAPGARIQTLPNNTTNYTFTWDTSASTASYKFIFGNPTTTTRKITLLPTGNSLNITGGQLDNILAGLGLAQGDSLVGQWDVWAFRNNAANDSLKAANGPRALTLKRAKPLLTAFNLIAPVTNTTILTLISNTSSTVNFNWTKSGEAVKYKWIYARPDFSTSSNIKFIVNADNGGFDSTLKIRNSRLDSMLAGIGVGVGDSSVGQWRVYGYSANDSIASSQTNNLTLRRGIPPTVTTSADSIVVNLSVNQTATRNLTIGNTGQFPLNFVITESSISLDNLATKVDNSEINNAIRNLPKGAVHNFHGPEVTDSQGGPDAGGYTWIDSDEPGGPAFNWVDITTTGTQITSWTNGSADDGSVIVPLSFNFSYYGNSYSQLKICTNGWVGFDVSSTSNAFSNTSIPDIALPNNVLYAFWDDLDFRVSGSVYYKNDAANNRFIIMYKDAPHYDPPAGGPYTFEVIIYNDGRIFYQYLNMNAPLNTHTIGTENTGGTIGLQIVFDNASYMHNNLAIKIEKGLSWVDVVPSNGTIAPSGNQTVAVNFNSTGLMPNSSYVGNLTIGTNDPVTPAKVVRIRLNVGPVGIGEQLTGIPTEFALNQNYPNPFNPSTRISYALPKEGFVTIKIFDILGKEVMTLVNENKVAGYYDAEFNAANFASGMYFYKLEAGSFIDTKRMLLIK